MEQEAIQLLKDGIDLVPDSDKALSNLLSYPLRDTLTRWLVNFSCLIYGFIDIKCHGFWVEKFLLNVMSDLNSYWSLAS